MTAAGVDVRALQAAVEKALDSPGWVKSSNKLLIGLRNQYPNSGDVLFELYNNYANAVQTQAVAKYSLKAYGPDVAKMKSALPAEKLEQVLKVENGVVRKCLKRDLSGLCLEIATADAKAITTKLPEKLTSISEDIMQLGQRNSDIALKLKDVSEAEAKFLKLFPKASDASEASVIISGMGELTTEQSNAMFVLKQSRSELRGMAKQALESEALQGTTKFKLQYALKKGEVKKAVKTLLDARSEFNAAAATRETMVNRVTDLLEKEGVGLHYNGNTLSNDFLSSLAKGEHGASDELRSLAKKFVEQREIVQQLESAKNSAEYAVSNLNKQGLITEESRQLLNGGTRIVNCRKRDASGNCISQVIDHTFQTTDAMGARVSRLAAENSQLRLGLDVRHHILFTP